MEKRNKHKPIKSFQDLEVYQRLYKLMIVILTKIIYQLPQEEKFDLINQMRRCCKASPALLAEGFAKRYQKKQWRKYLDDSIGENNEMIHHLSVCRDVYKNKINNKLCQEIIDEYDIANRQLYRLKESWQNFQAKINH